MNLHSFLLIAQQTADQEAPGIALPSAASTVARDVDFVFGVIFWISFVFFIGISAALTYFVIRYNRGDAPHPEESPAHSNALEALWSIIPSLLVAWIFVAGAITYVNIRQAPEETLDIDVTAYRFGWRFRYPNGGQSEELVVPVDTPVKLRMRSDDVIHSFFIYNFRVKQDVLPDRFTTLWFQPTMPGVYKLQCTEYCGDGHSQMNRDVRVVSLSEYEDFLETTAVPDGELWEIGEFYYRLQGCAGCHAVDGPDKVGPGFKNLYGSERQLTTGETVIADEEYLERSIRYPDQERVGGYAGKNMPSQWTNAPQDQIDALVAFIRFQNEEEREKMLAEAKAAAGDGDDQAAGDSGDAETTADPVEAANE